ncbi:SRPBCC family protein [Amnibacterium sp.]|uniref:SRPBCC family protein n=1 Tax=Amnibacterium sp. TaxID=1872496 RepID=UPI003F7B7DBC
MTDRVLSVVRPHRDAALVHVEDVYATSPEDLWSAITRPERLSRWIAEVTGDLAVGGAFRIRFTSSWEGDGRVDECEPPHRLVVTTVAEDGSSTEIVATVTPEGDGARLVVEERGLPVDEAPDHAAGWQVHLEDLGTALAGRTPGDWAARWRELIPVYRPGSGPAA